MIGRNIKCSRNWFIIEMRERKPNSFKVIHEYEGDTLIALISLASGSTHTDIIEMHIMN
jgi:hypothetical protein